MGAESSDWDQGIPYGQNWKGKASPALYFIGIVSAQWSPTAAKLIYLGLALLWLIPDRRIENLLVDSKE
ncbi:MAG: hypothetical protein WCY91_11655 [Acidithiobacillus sp.]|jgi:hypothetical protein|uniref:hypothetical protein n=1 Tax=Acidithiobacillus sp. TaxID=1872118 RepID=UPI003561066F